MEARLDSEIVIQTREISNSEEEETNLKSLGDRINMLWLPAGYEKKSEASRMILFSAINY